MNNLNSLIVEGTVVRDAVFSEPVTGFQVTKFPIAVNRWYQTPDGKGMSEVSYFDVEAHAKLAEYCAKKANKGRGIRVVGRIKQDRWNDKDTGKATSKVKIIAEHIEYKPIYDETSEKTGNFDDKKHKGSDKEVKASSSEYKEAENQDYVETESQVASENEVTF